MTEWVFGYDGMNVRWFNRNFLLFDENIDLMNLIYVTNVLERAGSVPISALRLWVDKMDSDPYVYLTKFKVLYK